MSPRQPQFERVRRLRSWLISAALLALTPKCFLCLLAYAGLGAALGLGGPELCGATANASGHGTTGLIVAGVTLGLVGAFGCWRRS